MMTQGIIKQSVSKVIMMTCSGGTIHKQAYIISHMTTGKCQQKKKKKGRRMGHGGVGWERQGKVKVNGNQAEKE